VEFNHPRISGRRGSLMQRARTIGLRGRYDESRTRGGEHCAIGNSHVEWAYDDYLGSEE